MKSRTLFSLFLPVMLLALAALACGGSSPVAFSDLPVFTGATEAQPGESTFGDLLVDVMSSAAADENATADLQLYIVPDGTTWANVKAFYDGELADTDWTAEPDLTEENEAISIAGWRRGSGAGEQALLVGFASDPLSGNDFLIVALLTE